MQKICGLLAGEKKIKIASLVLRHSSFLFCIDARIHFCLSGSLNFHFLLKISIDRLKNLLPITPYITVLTVIPTPEVISSVTPFSVE